MEKKSGSNNMTQAQEIIDFIENHEDVVIYRLKLQQAVCNPYPPKQILKTIHENRVRYYKGKVDPRLLFNFIESYLRLTT